MENQGNRESKRRGSTANRTRKKPDRQVCNDQNLLQQNPCCHQALLLLSRAEGRVAPTAEREADEEEEELADKEEEGEDGRGERGPCFRLSQQQPLHLAWWKTDDEVIDCARTCLCWSCFDFCRRLVRVEMVTERTLRMRSRASSTFIVSFKSSRC